MNVNFHHFSIDVSAKPLSNDQLVKYSDQRPHKLKTDKSDPSKMYMCTLNRKNYLIEIDTTNVPRDKTRAIARQEINKLQNHLMKDQIVQQKNSTYVYDSYLKTSIEIRG